MKLRDYFRFAYMLAGWGALSIIPEDPAVLGISLWFTTICAALLAVGFQWQIMALLSAAAGMVVLAHEKMGQAWGWAALAAIPAGVAIACKIVPER